MVHVCLHKTKELILTRKWTITAHRHCGKNHSDLQKLLINTPLCISFPQLPFSAANNRRDVSSMSWVMPASWTKHVCQMSRFTITPWQVCPSKSESNSLPILWHWVTQSHSLPFPWLKGNSSCYIKFSVGVLGKDFWIKCIQTSFVG